MVNVLLQTTTQICDKKTHRILVRDLHTFKTVRWRAISIGTNDIHCSLYVMLSAQSHQAVSSLKVKPKRNVNICRPSPNTGQLQYYALLFTAVSDIICTRLCLQQGCQWHNPSSKMSSGPGRPQWAHAQSCVGPLWQSWAWEHSFTGKRSSGWRRPWLAS